MFRTLLPAVAALLLAGSLSLPASAQEELTGDPVAGRKALSHCAACHSVTSSRSGMGPHLRGVVGRPVASVPDFRLYSDTLKQAGAAGRVWDKPLLEAFLYNPRKTMPGTSMRFFGLWSEQQIVDLIAYLETIKAE